MANPMHLRTLIAGGVTSWNEWRRTNPSIQPNLDDADLDGRDLSGAELSGAILFEANLSNANLSRARLRGAILQGADLRQADLREANLTDADLSGTWPGDPVPRLAWPTGANLGGANLHETEFCHASVAGANFAEARLYRTVFADVDLSQAQGLETVVHDGPSEISVSTLYRSKGQIPEAFLHGTGVQRRLFDDLPRLQEAIEPIEYYSCFLSHSSEDKDFADRLYSRMRQEQLRVWYAPEHMQAGKVIHEQVYEAIRLRDKLLLILSQSSMRSSWVASEIRRAIRREKEEERRHDKRRRILFPIGLVSLDKIREWELFDDDSGTDLAIKIRSYYILDFSEWRNPASFEASFAKLLQGLRVEG
jgi:hypothetical protein